MNIRDEISKVLDKHFPDEMDSHMYHPHNPSATDAIVNIFHSQIHEIEKLKKEPVEGMYCGCDGECFASCNDSFNNAIRQVLQILGEREKTLEK